uniref:Uncharacterized protein n=1 Tax=Meloidogyne hapla TaxID=6305 RepID=A0A1I8BSQ1_MELHA
MQAVWKEYNNNNTKKWSESDSLLEKSKQATNKEIQDSEQIITFFSNLNCEQEIEDCGQLNTPNTLYTDKNELTTFICSVSEMAKDLNLLFVQQP